MKLMIVISIIPVDTLNPSQIGTLGLQLLIVNDGCFFRAIACQLHGSSLLS
jgi:hypothetical protein